MKEENLEVCWAILESLGHEFSLEEIDEIFKSDNYYINRDKLRATIINMRNKREA